MTQLCEVGLSLLLINENSVTTFPLFLRSWILSSDSHNTHSRKRTYLQFHALYTALPTLIIDFVFTRNYCILRQRLIKIQRTVQKYVNAIRVRHSRRVWFLSELIAQSVYLLDRVCIVSVSVRIIKRKSCLIAREIIAYCSTALWEIVMLWRAACRR